MIKNFFTLILFFTIFEISAQVINKTDSNTLANRDTLVVDSGKKDSLKIFRPTIKDYQYHTQFSEKKFIDTTFSIDKSYQFTEYNNKDNFGLQRFANIGSGFNPLIYQSNTQQHLTLLPTNKSYTFLGIHDIKYYDVKTPTTTFIYHNALRNGAALNTTYTQNVGKNFNFAVEYLGLRSQGFYRNSLAANNNTLFSAHYTSNNKRYEFFAHYIHQNINNEENGGIAEDQLYRNGDSSIKSRINVQINLQNSTSRFSARRYYFSHQYTPFNSEKYPFRIRHTLFHQGNKYSFKENNPETYYYSQTSDLVPELFNETGKYSDNLSNTVSLILDHRNLKIDAGVRHQNIKFGAYQAVQISNLLIPDRIQENRLGLVANLQANLFNKIQVQSEVELSRGNQFGNYVKIQNNARLEPLPGYFLDAHAHFYSVAPSFNYLLNTSLYRKFNYYFSDFKNQNNVEIGGSMNLKWFKSKVYANYFRIDNFAYFGNDGLPKQSENSVSISQIGSEATIDYRKFHLNARVHFQSTFTNKELLPLPNFVGRINAFYQSKMFKDAAEIQTGIKTNFYTKFNSRLFLPVTNEFILPATAAQSVGGFPFVDAYFNMKVKRMFFFVEGQHLIASIKQNTAYTTPLFPTQDFRINIGIVWYLIN